MPSRRVHWDLIPEHWRAPVAALIEEAAAAPPLQGLDVFAGTKGMARAMWEVGHMPCITFEKTDDQQWENILHAKGLSYLVWLVLRVAPGGLVFMGPPCKFWIFLTLSHTCRTKIDPQGSPLSWMAREGNQIADATAKVALLCKAMGIHFVVEHPLGSFLWKYPPLQVALQAAGAIFIHFDMAVFGHAALKPTRLAGTAPWLRALGSLCALLPLPETLTTLADFDGDAVTGKRIELGESAAYPTEFCKTVATFHKASLLNAAPSQERGRKTCGKFSDASGHHQAHAGLDKL